MTTFEMIKEVYNNLIFPNGTPKVFIAAAVVIGILISPLLVVAGVGFGLYSLVNLIKNRGKGKDPESQVNKEIAKLKKDATKVGGAYATLYPVLKYLPGGSKLKNPVEVEGNIESIFTVINVGAATVQNNTAKKVGTRLAENAFDYIRTKMKNYKQAATTIIEVGQGFLASATGSDEFSQALNAAAKNFGAKVHTPVDQELSNAMKDIDENNYLDKIKILKDTIKESCGLKGSQWAAFYGTPQDVEGKTKFGGEYAGNKNNNLFVYMQQLEYYAELEKKHREKKHRKKPQEIRLQEIRLEVAKATATTKMKDLLSVANLALVDGLKGLKSDASHSLEILATEKIDLLQEIGRHIQWYKREIPYNHKKIQDLKTEISGNNEALEALPATEENSVVRNELTLQIQKRRHDLKSQSQDLAKMKANLASDQKKYSVLLTGDNSTDVDKVAVHQQALRGLETLKKEAKNSSELTELNNQITVAENEIKKIYASYPSKDKKLLDAEVKEVLKGTSLEPDSVNKKIELTPEAKASLTDQLNRCIETIDRLLNKANPDPFKSFSHDYKSLSALTHEDSMNDIRSVVEQIKVIRNEIGLSGDKAQLMFGSSAANALETIRRVDDALSLEKSRATAIREIKNAMSGGEFYMTSYTDQIITPQGSQSPRM